MTQHEVLEKERTPLTSKALSLIRRENKKQKNYNTA